MRVLGIETSCDETGIAIYCGEQGLRAHQLYSQVSLHAQYGGVVPELASRDHIRKIIPLIQATLDEAGLTGKELEGVAYTAGPGLVGALLVGAAVARSLAYGWQIPAIGVHHLEGHLLAPMLEECPPAFPFVALLVSGGHTLLVEVDGVGQYRLLGESRDDAAGEAFDKTAKQLGLPYPGGAALAKLAETGDATRFHFPRPMTDTKNLEFSFSGLKTAALVAISQHDKSARADIAASFQAAIIDTLCIKCEHALAATGLTRLVVAGGVSANRALRERLTTLAATLGGSVYFPRPEFCTDNGAMIAYAGYARLINGQHDDLAIQAKARWGMGELSFFSV